VVASAALTRPYRLGFSMSIFIWMYSAVTAIRGSLEKVKAMPIDCTAELGIRKLLSREFRRWVGVVIRQPSQFHLDTHKARR